MTRRDFLSTIGLSAGAVALSPMLDLAAIVPAPSLAKAPLSFGNRFIQAGVYVPLFGEFEDTWRSGYLGIARG